MLKSWVGEVWVERRGYRMNRVSFSFSVGNWLGSWSYIFVSYISIIRLIFKDKEMRYFREVSEGLEGSIWISFFFYYVAFVIFFLGRGGRGKKNIVLRGSLR